LTLLRPELLHFLPDFGRILISPRPHPWLLSSVNPSVSEFACVHKSAILPEIVLLEPLKDSNVYALAESSHAHSVLSLLSFHKHPDPLRDFFLLLPQMENKMPS
jgi:hypothetical protein